MDAAIKHEYIKTNGITLHTTFAGDAAGEPIIFLHGFPEFWYGWKKQIPFFAEQGYRVIAPDQRGYNLSDKPKGIGAYHVDHLAADIAGLIDSLDYEKVYLVGHDWGAAVSWRTAMLYPERIKKLMILNVPHLNVMQQELRSGNLSQLRKSWYIFFFQLPRIPEKILSANDWARAAKSLIDSSHPGTFSDDDLEQYKKAWSVPGAFSSMLNWYRAMFQSAQILKGNNRITVPTLILWGEQDKFLGKELVEPSLEFCDDGRAITFPDATHWVQHEKAAEVNQHLLEFIRS